MYDEKPKEIPIETPEPTEVVELEDKELEEVAGGLKQPTEDVNCHNTQCC